MWNRDEEVNKCGGGEFCMSLTMSSLTLLCIFLDLLKILQLLTHDLRDTRDNRVNVHPPQPIGLPVLTLRPARRPAVASTELCAHHRRHARDDEECTAWKLNAVLDARRSLARRRYGSLARNMLAASALLTSAQRPLHVH